MSATESAAIEAVAEAWASIDGKLDEFHASKDEVGGTYACYMCEAAELLARIRARGYVLTPLPPPPTEDGGSDERA